MSHPGPVFRDAWDLPIGEPQRIVVVGGGPAGHRAALELRKLGFNGSVTVVGRENIPPYDRTLVSKGNLTAPEPAIAPMAGPGLYEELNVDLQLGSEAIALNPARQTIELAGGAQLSYDRLILAVGGAPVLPAALAAPGVLTVRSFADVAPIRDALERSRHVVVIGAGFVGGEVAAAATKYGCGTTLIEACDVPLQPVIGSEVGNRIEELHLKQGVDVRCGVQAETVSDRGGSYEIELSNGRRVSCDSVIVAVGTRPYVDWLAPSRIEIDRGILTDPACRTSLPGVLAAGDCAQWWSTRYGTYCHIAHWDSAGKHAATAARTALDLDATFDPIPFFWSDQYDVKYQWAGHAPQWDTVDISGDGPDDFAARYLNDGQMVGVFTANRPKEFAQLRRQLSETLDESKKEDKEVSLR